MQVLLRSGKSQVGVYKKTVNNMNIGNVISEFFWVQAERGGGGGDDQRI